MGGYVLTSMCEGGSQEEHVDDHQSNFRMEYARQDKHPRQGAETDSARALHADVIMPPAKIMPPGQTQQVSGMWCNLC